ncbi:MAG TPA: transcriptional regulator [Phycisphaerae bacterium]|nr:transcriptional regulator [Phycisphaerae bacterium]
MKKIGSRGAARRHASAGRRIIAGLQEILDARASGRPLRETFTVHTVEVQEPGHYDAAAIRQTRAKLNVSQAVFAKIVGVSNILAQSWEQGKRFPDGPSRRVLDEINRDPKHWGGMIRTSSTGRV